MKAKKKLLSIMLCMLVAALNFPICRALEQTENLEITDQSDPPYTVTIRKFIGGFVTNVTFGYKSMSFDAVIVCLISRVAFRGFEKNWYTNGYTITIKQTDFKGIMKDSFLFGISSYNYSVHC